MASIYEDLGFLILGSRLRRMSEYFLAEVNSVYQHLELPFEASWFPLFYLLAHGKELSIRQVADELMTSHSAISQLVTKLKEKGLIKSFADAKDKRVQMITLTTKGAQLKNKLLPIWDGISKSMHVMEASYPEVAHFLPAIAKLEQHFEAQSLSSIIVDEVAMDQGNKKGASLTTVLKKAKVNRRK